MERVYFAKTGRLARPLRDYDHLTLLAIVHYWDEVEGKEEWDPFLRRFVIRKGLRTGVKPGKKRITFDTPVLTGDPVADEWERAVARGEDPDL